MKISRVKVILVTTILTLLLLLFYQIQDSKMKIDLLVKNHQKQLTKIELLESENERLEKVILFQHQEIKNLQSKSVAVEPKIIHSKENKSIHNEEVNIMDLINSPTIVAGTLATFGAMLKTLIPSF